MPKVFMTDKVTGRCAIFDEQAGTANAATYADPNSDINAPLNNPTDYLAALYFHTDFDMLEVAHSSSPTISHAAISSATDYNNTSSNVSFNWSETTNDYLLATHSLGYVPTFIVAFDDNVLYPGSIVQTNINGSSRYVTAYATTTEIRLKEFAAVGSAALPALSIEYSVLAFKQPATDSGTYLVDFNKIIGVLELSFGKFKSDRRYLQVAPGGSPLGFSTGRMVDLKNGAIRAVNADGSYYDPVPSTMAFKTKWDDGLSIGGYGSAANYNGSFTGSPAVQVQAP